jgi:hypothetical protein
MKIIQGRGRQSNRTPRRGSHFTITAGPTWISPATVAAARGRNMCQFENIALFRARSILPAVEFLSAGLRPIPRVHYFFDHLD